MKGSNGWSESAEQGPICNHCFQWRIQGGCRMAGPLSSDLWVFYFWSSNSKILAPTRSHVTSHYEVFKINFLSANTRKRKTLTFFKLSALGGVSPEFCGMCARRLSKTILDWHNFYLKLTVLTSTYAYRYFKEIVRSNFLYELGYSFSIITESSFSPYWL